MNRSGKDSRCVRSGYVWRWHPPGCVSIIEPALTRPTLHWHNFQIAVDLEMTIEQACKFAKCHAVSRRQRKLTNERRELRDQNVTRYLNSADRVRPIANDHLLAEFPGGSHAIRHRVSKGVNTTTNALHVKHEHIDL